MECIKADSGEVEAESTTYDSMIRTQSRKKL